MSNSVGVSVLECKTIILILCGHFKAWYGLWIEGEGDGEEKDVDKTIIYLNQSYYSIWNDTLLTLYFMNTK